MDMRKSELGLDKCPLCREPIDYYATTEADEAAQLTKLVTRGHYRDRRSSTIYDIGEKRCFLGSKLRGQMHVARSRRVQKAREMRTGMAKQGSGSKSSTSSLHLATSYGDGMAPVLRKSEEKAKQLLMKSANLGFALANSNSLLAQSFFCGNRGFEKDQDEAYFRATVAFALDDTNQEVAEVLGRLHYFRPGIPKPSPYIACYYLNIAANEDKGAGGMASFYYTRTLTENDRLHDNNYEIQ